ncbi:WYL domain-containing protein [Methylomarinum sp. Ch1-1]|uniref:WYL domain-containing protein n=1 Tax=Methylomarinum roseum TaxID=3067653 RepID=A0AAU7NWK6_9GAMM|nr:WYL domain-containing protein [Methylomarinum sp. Ch1-1]MDP4522641.1 WYL domain-containing protein [Methylomarinum sp. Ch1-1]
MDSQPRILLDDIGQAQQERLFYIDFKLRFSGLINRTDLVSRFGIKAAAATRDLAQYKEIAPDNLIYDTKVKRYLQAGDFKPVFAYPGGQALAALCHGLGDDHVCVQSALISAEVPTQLNTPNLDILAEVSKAIYQQKILTVDYQSLSSGRSKRDIVPFALVDNGLRCHVRAFDRKREQFGDFVINRISAASLHDGYIPNTQTREADIQWNRIVEMHIVPHPRLAHPETIAMEYGMEHDVLKANVRAAVAGYVLRRWNVDCTDDHSLTGSEYHLWLKNTVTLYGVENLAIAPGYQTE